jgi:FkbM family methyltransferase
MLLLDTLSFNEIDIYQEIKEWIINHNCSGIYIWGTGSVASGIAKQLIAHNIPVSGFFNDVTDFIIDNRVKELEIPIFSIEQIPQSSESVGVVVGHSHYELVSNLNRYCFIKHVWCLVDATRDDIAISAAAVKNNIDILQNIYDKLADDTSRKVLFKYLNAKLTKDASYLKDECQKPHSFFDDEEILKYSNDMTYLDIGAYDGKSIADFLSVLHRKKIYKYNIIAIEVQKCMCKMLFDKYSEDSNISIVNYGVSDHVGTDFFSFDEQSTCLDSSGIESEVTTIDEICQGKEKISLIKICIGCSILPVLEGARNTISHDMPAIIISAGIDSRALFDYIPFLESVVGSRKYNYYFRLLTPMTESLVLYAIP